MKKSLLVLLALTIAAVLSAPASAWPYNQWIVTPVVSSEPSNTVHVMISVTLDTGACGMCNSVGMPTVTLSVSPCPLARSCSGGTYQASYPALSAADTLSLQCGVPYTFSGSWSWNVITMGPVPYPPYYACVQLAQCGGPMLAAVFNQLPVAARGTSWGRLKVLYR